MFASQQQRFHFSDTLEGEVIKDDSMDKGNSKPATKKLRRRKTVKKDLDLNGKLSALPKKPPSPPLLRHQSQHGLKQQEPNGKATIVIPRQQSTDIGTNDSCLPAETQSE